MIWRLVLLGLIRSAWVESFVVSRSLASSKESAQSFPFKGLVRPSPPSFRLSSEAAGVDKSENEDVDSLLYGSGLYQSRRLVDRVFDKADTNKDGKVDISETYELVLKIYVLLNRQGPLAPPTKENINLIFQQCDLNNDQSIDRSEFGRMVSVLIRRAFWRLAAYKVVSVIGAPLLTEYIVRKWRYNKWFLGWITAKCANYPRLQQLVTSSAFWRTVLLIGLVKTLGDFVLYVVNRILDYSRRVNKIIMEELATEGEVNGESGATSGEKQ